MGTLVIRLVPLLLLFAGCRGASVPTPSAHTPAVDLLITRMNERLALMHDVARWKWNETKPIADPARERELLDAMSDRGAGMGLEREAVRRFFAAQIEEAKLLQQSYFDRWSSDKQGPFPDAVPLAELRKRIDVLNGKLLESLAATQGVSSSVIRERADVILQGESVTPAIREAAMAAWRE